jgi:hypothetical protein
LERIVTLEHDDLQMLVFTVTVIIVGLVMAALFAIDRRIHKRLYKKRKAELIDAVILPVLNEVFDQVEYLPDGSIPKEVIDLSSLFDCWTNFHGEDYAAGTYKGLRIQMSDISLWHKELGDNPYAEAFTGDVFDFRGQWVTCDFGRNLAARVTLRTCEGADKGFFHRLSEKQLSSIEMESQEFNKTYTVLTDYAIEAYRVLTPHVMEYIIEANNKTGGRLSMEFMPGGILNIALNTDNSYLEPSDITGKLDYQAEKKRIVDEMRFVTDIIDFLKDTDAIFK